jgi:hypothetical protein
VADDINLAAEELLQFADQRGVRQESPSRLELNQQVDVAVSALFAARDRAEYLKVPGSVPKSDCLYLLDSPVQFL